MSSLLINIAIICGILFISCECKKNKGDSKKVLLKKLAAVELNTELAMERLDELEEFVDAEINQQLRVEDLERRGGWELVFRATSGNGHNVYDAWKLGSKTCQTKPETMDRSLSCHYRSSIVSTWASANIKKVKFALYTEDKEVAYIIFNGENTDSMNWFDAKNVLESTWSDLTPQGTYNYFSIDGHRVDTVDRKFFINRNYGGCGVDRGHLVVIDTLSQGKPCVMDRQPVYPQFLYSQINTADYWQDALFGRADYMAIFVKT